MTRVDREAGKSAVIAGGGIAGVAAAVALAERGVTVTIAERESFLGGRAGAWIERLPDGEPFEMERGFHAFFRQYYNLRALLRRVDPFLSRLAAVADYPILGPDGAAESFADLPTAPPWNVAALVKRTPSLRLADLPKVDKRAVLAMLAYDPERTYARWGNTSARAYLDALRFPPRARRMLFDVFAHSFFNPEAEMSAGELLMMFHFYFIGNREGLVFDVATRPFFTAFWDPLRRYLERRGARIVLGREVRAVSARGGAWRVDTDGGAIDADAVVLATHVPGLQRIVDASPDLGDAAWRRDVASLSVTRPFAVWRLWLDRPTRAGRAPFAGTTGLGALDNISLYHLIEDESRAFADRHGGAVVELHAYAVSDPVDDEALRSDLLAGLHALYPETRGARVLHERFLVHRDCPAFPPGEDHNRPGVSAPVPGVALAGDFVSLPFPSALMERAAASGFLAAHRAMGHMLPGDVAPERIPSVPPRGILARRRRGPIRPAGG